MLVREVPDRRDTVVAVRTLSDQLDVILDTDHRS
jgi:hypothetical protein